MAGRLRDSASLGTTDPGTGEPALIPCLLLRKGVVCLPGEDGPQPAVPKDGGRFDPFDVVDRLAKEYPLVYLVDLTGVERAEPQLDFIQELSREVTLWVDGGVRNAEQAIDILVAGAQRAVLSSAILRGPRELRRSWRLSTEYAFELEFGADGLVVAGEWGAVDSAAVVSSVREVGVDHLIVSPRGNEPDWSLVRTIASGGPTWVDGSFEPSQLASLRQAGARGGIFHIGELIGARSQAIPDSDSPTDSTVRDDET
jgi:hypothetical protein